MRMILITSFLMLVFSYLPTHAAEILATHPFAVIPTCEENQNQSLIVNMWFVAEVENVNVSGAAYITFPCQGGRSTNVKVGIEDDTIHETRMPHWEARKLFVANQPKIEILVKNLLKDLEVGQVPD